MTHDLLRIADAYYFFQDYGEAKKFLEKIIILPETEFNTRFVNSARNTLGLCYQKENRLDEADFYFREVSKTPFPHSKVVWERIANGNIGTSYYLRVLALARLNLSTREMAGILGVGTDTIRQHRSRIRRKLGLSDETDLGTLITGL